MNPQTNFPEKYAVKETVYKPRGDCMIDDVFRSRSPGAKPKEVSKVYWVDKDIEQVRGSDAWFSSRNV